MEQKLVKKDELIKSLGQYIFLLRQDSKRDKSDIEGARKQYKLYELYKTLNPKYSENIFSLKDAKLKVDSSDIIYSSKYNMFRPY